MDADILISYAKEFSFALSILAISLAWAIFRGRQSVINIICSIYLSLVLFNAFPYQAQFVSISNNADTQAIILILLFGTICIGSFLLFSRIMPREYLENKFESLPRKALLASGLTVLTVLVCYTSLPISSFITPQPELFSILTKDHLEFWWLLLPLGIIASN
jgi:amino acid transporter